MIFHWSGLVKTIKCVFLTSSNCIFLRMENMSVLIMPDVLPDTILYSVQAGDRHREAWTWVPLQLDTLGISVKVLHSSMLILERKPGFPARLLHTQLTER